MNAPDNPRVPSDVMVALQAAIRLAQQGDRAAARDQLLAITAANPSLELGWLWLASVTDDLAERVTLLKRVLAINPGNDKARQALSQISGETSLPAPATVNPPVRSGTPLGAVETVLLIILALLVIALLIGGGGLLLSGKLTQPSDTPTASMTLTLSPTATLIHSLTPSITPGGPTATPYIAPTLPPSWTAMPSQTALPSFTPLATDTLLPSATITPTLLSSTVVISPTRTAVPTLPPLATLPGVPNAPTSTATVDVL